MADYALEGPKWGGAAYGTAGGTVTWAVDATVPASFVSVLSAALADWSAHANIRFAQIASTALSQIDFTVAAIDGLNTVLGRTSIAWSGATLTSAAVTFDSGEGWHASGSKVVSNAGVDLFVVAVHEIGHALGLDHYNATPAVMNAYLNRTVTDVTSSDIDGIQALYGPPVTTVVAAAPAPSATVSPSTTTSGTPTPSVPQTPSVTSTAITPAAGATTGSHPTATAPAASDAPASAPAPAAPTVSATVTHDVYRFYDTATGDHFYTASASETAQIQATLPSYHYEGAGFATPDKAAGTLDVYRFYDTASGSHFFTASLAERDSVIATLPSYHYEGVAFQTAATGAAGSFALERFYNPGSGQHHYATPQEAALMLAGSAGPGWVDEGKAFLVHAASGLLT